MDNFILYDEISKSDNSIIYKGRRKGSINFVAIHCIDKSLRPEITNLVRLTYELSHKNVVKFYEWYETSNHLWLVVELCTAGTLDLLLVQDGSLPESSIRQFGVDLIEGLFYIHSLGLLFCDLIPRKIMIDGNGTLKLSDFGLSKMEGEDLETIFQETIDATSSQWSQSAGSSGKPPKVYRKPFGEIGFLAPEVLLGEDNSKESDLWSLGVNLYQMYTGSLPFVSEDNEQLKHMIISKELPNPKGNKLSTKPSTEFLSLLRGLLEKNPLKRYNWRHLLRHPFWENKLLHLVPATLSTKSIIVDGKEQVIEDEENENDVHFMNMSRLSTDRHRASTVLEKNPEINVSFSISSRLPVSPKATIQTRNPVQCKESEETQASNASTLVSQNLKETLTEPFVVQNDKRTEYRRLFFISSELNVSQIIDNPKISKPASLKFEPKVLPIANPKLHKAESFIQISRDEYEKSIEAIKANTNVPSDKSAGAIKLKLHLMNYIGTLCTESSRIADSFVQVELYKDLLSIIKNGHNLEMKMKAARIFGILFNKAKRLDPSKDMVDVLQGLVEIISANRKDVKFKQALLPALGELLYFLCCQETVAGKPMDTWTVPSLVYVLMIKNVGEDLMINHIVCKIIENISSTNSHSVQKFISNQSEVVNSLWSCYSHSANNEALRVASLHALCMLSSHSINVFLTLIDKIGIDSILDCLGNPNSQIQQAILTMLCMLINEQNYKNLSEKKLISKLVAIYESTNVISRAKAYLLTFVLLKQQPDLLPMFTQSKLINSIERDLRKNFPNKEESEYINKNINMLINLLTTVANSILDEAVMALESVYGRKNPSPAQTKQLKRVIPSVSDLKVLVSSQTFRLRLMTQEFVEKLGQLIKLSKPLNNGDLNIDAICGNGTTSDYIDAIIGILDMFIQNKEILESFANEILKFVLPPLMDNIDTANSDLRVQSLKFLSEITVLYLNKQEPIDDDVRKLLKTTIETSFIEMVDKLITQPEPLPFFSLKILQAVLNYDITLINTLKVKNVLPNLFRLFQNYKNKIGSAFVVKILNVLYLWSSTVDPMDLFENGIIELFKTVLSELSRPKKLDDRILIETLIETLKIVDNLLKFVSDLVKKALNAKKTFGASDQLAQQAEKLLQSNKPLVSYCSFFISLLTSDDSDLSELSCKILWIIMQLFGTESKDLINKENLNYLMTAINTSNSKKQKILLRIVKRMISTDNVETFKVIGQTFIENLKALKSSANAEANVSLTSMIDEILKLL